MNKKTNTTLTRYIISYTTTSTTTKKKRDRETTTTTGSHTIKNYPGQRAKIHHYHTQPCTLKSPHLYRKVEFAGQNNTIIAI